VNQNALNKTEDFTHLYQSLFEPLLHFASTILNCKNTAEDTVQDVFVKFWDLDPEKCTIRCPRKLLFTMTHNLCIDRLRRLRYQEKLAHELGNRELSAPLTEHYIEDLENQVLLQQAFNRLSPRRKKIFYLIRIEGWKRQKVAATLGISEETVKESLRLALKSIRLYICSHNGLKTCSRTVRNK
jgi:RNA polymerase sigma-70 factor (ECF subfamily)